MQVSILQICQHPPNTGDKGVCVCVCVCVCAMMAGCRSGRGGKHSAIFWEASEGAAASAQLPLSLSLSLLEVSLPLAIHLVKRQVRDIFGNEGV